MELFSQIHGAEYVYATENELYIWVWHGGPNFNLYDINGENIDCFEMHGIENAAQAEFAIESHIKENQ